MQINERDIRFTGIKSEKLGSIFDNSHPDSPIEVINLLKLAEKEGAYFKLSEKRRKVLEMRYIEGLNNSQIGDVLNVSKQVVSQAILGSPEILYRKMLKDISMRKTFISFREILGAYSDYKIFLDSKKRSGK